MGVPVAQLPRPSNNVTVWTGVYLDPATDQFVTYFAISGDEYGHENLLFGVDGDPARVIFEHHGVKIVVTN